MKSVCILVGSMKHGGTDSFALHLAKGLSKRGHNPIVIIASNEKSLCTREHLLVEEGIATLHTYDPIGLKGKLKHLAMLYIYLRGGQFDAFQTNMDLFNGFNLFVAWLAGVPIRECHSHSSRHAKELKYGRTLSVRLYQAVTRWMCWTFSNRRSGCSEHAMTFLYGDRWRDDQKSVVIYNGIDMSGFSRLSDEQNTAVKGRKFICAVGNISYPKNPIFIVDIMRIINHMRSDIVLLWAGDGEMMPEVKSRVAVSGLANNVKLLGYRDDVAEIMRKSELMILPSLYEGLSYVTIEAQATGLPCLVSDAVPKEVDCGGCEFLPITNSDIWAERICRIVDDETPISIDEAKLQRFSDRMMVQRMEDLLDG